MALIITGAQLLDSCGLLLVLGGFYVRFIPSTLSTVEPRPQTNASLDNYNMYLSHLHTPPF
jgi:hypothetical protein